MRCPFTNVPFVLSSMSVNLSRLTSTRAWTRGLFVNLALDHAVCEAVLSAGAVNFVNFTGSVGGGRAIERAAAGTFTGVGLELGGKDPFIVLASADPEAAARTALRPLLDRSETR